MDIKRGFGPVFYVTLTVHMRGVAFVAMTEHSPPDSGTSNKDKGIYTPPDAKRINDALAFGQLIAAEMLRKRGEIIRAVSPQHP